MSILNSYVSWFASILLVICFVVGFYVDAAVQQLLRQIMKAEPREWLVTEARATSKRWFRWRLRWLKSRVNDLPGEMHLKARRILAFDRWSIFLFVVVFILYIYDVLIIGN
jgi:hypothetical protein